MSVEKSDIGGQGEHLSPGVGSIEGQTFLVREAQTTCLRFDLTPTPYAIPGPSFPSVQESSVPVNHQKRLPQTRTIVSVRSGNARDFLKSLSVQKANPLKTLPKIVENKLFAFRVGVHVWMDDGR